MDNAHELFKKENLQQATKDVYEGLVQVLTGLDAVQIDSADLDQDARFAEDLSIDSLSMVEIAELVSDLFEVDVSAQEMLEQESIGSAVEMVLDKLFRLESDHLLFVYGKIVGLQPVA